APPRFRRRSHTSSRRSGSAPDWREPARLARTTPPAALSQEGQDCGEGPSCRLRRHLERCQCRQLARISPLDRGNEVPSYLRGKASQCAVLVIGERLQRDERAELLPIDHFACGKHLGQWYLCLR